jgi:hypothetical protein
MTDYNDPAGTAYDPFRAQDANDTAYGVNYVDAEVQYLLEQVFNPEDLTDANDMPFMWNAVGQSSAATDSVGSAMMSDFGDWLGEPLGLFDRNDTAFPWTAPTVMMKGTIPYALTFGSTNYVETFSNAGEGTGADTTDYVRTGLNGFVFNFYDAHTSARSPPQPIAGGFSTGTGTPYWYPSKAPLFERWLGSTTFVPAAYSASPAEGIQTLGGVKANGVTRYFNDFYFALSREGTTGNALVNGGTVTGSAPTSDGTIETFDYFPVSTWNSGADATANGFGYREGTVVIAMARDINGTRGLAVYGWDGRDTYWGTAWASEYLGVASSWIKPGTVALILQITYSAGNREPTALTLVNALGTITEWGSNQFDIDYNYDVIGTVWTGDITLPALSYTSPPYVYEWWYEKLPSESEAKVDFDP